MNQAKLSTSPWTGYIDEMGGRLPLAQVQIQRDKATSLSRPGMITRLWTLARARGQVRRAGASISPRHDARHQDSGHAFCFAARTISLQIVVMPGGVGDEVAAAGTRRSQHPSDLCLKPSLVAVMLALTARWVVAKDNHGRAL